MRRLVCIALITLALVSAGATVWRGYVLWMVERDNADIRALAAGQNVARRATANPNALHAHVLFLSWRDNLSEAQEILAAMGTERPDLLAEVHFAIGNAQMRAAYEQIEANRLEDAVPAVNLAKAAYREALRILPDYRDAKVNLDLAMRLVRDMPRPEAEGEDDPENRPRRLWTDLPGLPRGAP